VQNNHHTVQNIDLEIKSYEATSRETERHDDNGYQVSYIDDNYDDIDEVMEIIDEFD